MSLVSTTPLVENWLSIIDCEVSASSSEDPASIVWSIIIKSTFVSSKESNRTSPNSKIQSNIISMRDHVHASSDGNGTKSTIVKASCGRSTFTSTFVSPNMVVLAPPVSDHLQSSSLSLPLNNRPRLVSLELQSSHPQHSHPHYRPVTALPNILLPRNRSNKMSLDEFDEESQHCAVTPDSKPMNHSHLGPPDQEIHLGMRPKVLDARTVRALGLSLAPLSSSLFSPSAVSFHSELTPLPAPRRPNKNAEMGKSMECWTPAPSRSDSEDIWRNMPGLPEMEESRSRNHMLLSKQTMPRSLFVPDDF